MLLIPSSNTPANITDFVSVVAGDDGYTVRMTNSEIIDLLGRVVTKTEDVDNLTAVETNGSGLFYSHTTGNHVYFTIAAADSSIGFSSGYSAKQVPLTSTGMPMVIG
ncbi:MAG: hypothetical protein KBF89_04530 [Acidimicrobiia bacterium]|nr:hypothetical protein [Acidimicrobiia bacterium]